MENGEDSYKVFYSWQSGNRTARNRIAKALDKAKEQLQEEGILIEITQDTNGRVGTQNIDKEVLQKIRDCDIFIADVTPILMANEEDEETGIKQAKLIPNPNVMYESGYALAHKGMGRMLFFASLEEGQELNQLPFDINHNTIKTLGEGDISSYLRTQFEKMVEEIDKERAHQGKVYDCIVLFDNGSTHSREITIKPIYQKRVYLPSQRTQPEMPAKARMSIAGSSLMDVFASPTGYISEVKVRPSEPFVHTSKEFINHGACPINLAVHNIGMSTLENLNLYVHIETPGVIIAEKNKERTGYAIESLLDRPDYTISSKNKARCNIGMLNSGDIYPLDVFYLVVPYGVNEISLRWNISAKDISAKTAPCGKLTIRVEPFVHPELDEKVNDMKAYEEEMVAYMEEVK